MTMRYRCIGGLSTEIRVHAALRSAEAVRELSAMQAAVWRGDPGAGYRSPDKDAWLLGEARVLADVIDPVRRMVERVFFRYFSFGFGAAR